MIFLRETWPALLPPLLGLVAIYVLLPRVRRSQPLIGAVAGALAIVLAGVFLVHMEAVWQETLLFYAFAGIAILSAGMMVTHHNPVYAALAFALVVLSTCGLFLLQAAPFLMAATIIIYAGAIVVTFLFVIMLAQQEGVSSADHRSREPFLSSLAGFVLMAAVLCVLYRSFDTHDLDGLIAQVQWVQKVENETEARTALPAPTAFTERVHAYLPTNGHVDDLESNRKLLDSGKATANQRTTALAMLKKNAGDLLPELQERRATLGQLSYQRQGEDRLTFGQAAPGRTYAGGQLPERNVAALGRTLFTDYLIPVALAAVLLLVATIGAIAVAGRRGEELR